MNQAVLKKGNVDHFGGLSELPQRLAALTTSHKQSWGSWSCRRLDWGGAVLRQFVMREAVGAGGQAEVHFLAFILFVSLSSITGQAEELPAGCWHLWEREGQQFVLHEPHPACTYRGRRA